MIRFSHCFLFSLALLVAAPVAQAQVKDPRFVGVPPSQPRPTRPEINELDGKLDAITDTASLEAMAARFRASKDVDSEGRVWRRLTELRPHIGRYKYEMAAAYGAQDLKTFAYNALLELQAQGYAYDIGKDPRFAPISSTEVWKYTAEGFDANRKPFGEGSTVATLPAEDLLIESIAWDPTRKAALVGSARDGAVYIVQAGGTLKPLVKADKDNGMWAVFDLAVDAERGVLWVASTAVPHYKGYNAETDLGRAGIFKYELKTGKFLKRFLSPTIAGQSFFMSTLALGPKGAVYAADGVNNAMYRIADDQLSRLFHAPVLGSIRGLAVSQDGKTVYFADHSRGLFGFDMQSMKPFELVGPPKLAQGGIEGVVWWKGKLVVVQNDMQPRRVMLLELSANGRSIASAIPLAANQPDLSLPTLATLDGDRVLIIGNSQKDAYDRFGLPRNASKLQGTRIYGLNLAEALARSKQAAE